MNREEEILRKHFLIKEGDSNRFIEQIKEAMRELARERAIGFNNWRGKNYIEAPSNTSDPIYYERKYYNTTEDLSGLTKHTTDQLYSKYEEHLKK